MSLPIRSKEGVEGKYPKSQGKENQSFLKNGLKHFLRPLVFATGRHKVEWRFFLFFFVAGGGEKRGEAGSYAVTHCAMDVGV